MPYQPIGKYKGSRGFARKTDFKRPVTFYDRVRFVGDDSTMEIFGGVLSGDISADNITLGTLAAARIAVGSLDGDKITAGTLTADEISVGTITIENLVFGSSDNLIQDPGFEAANLNLWNVNNGGATGWTNAVTGSARGGARVARFDPANQTTTGVLTANVPIGNNRFDINEHPSATVGDKFHHEAYVRGISGSAWNDCLVGLVFVDETNSQISGTTGSAVTPVAGSWGKMTVEATAPAGTAYVIFTLHVLNGGNAGVIIFDDAYARRKVGTLIIEDQAVDIERMLDPVFVDSGFVRNTSQTWTTSTGVKSTDTITVPDWVGTLTVFATGVCDLFGLAGGQSWRAWLNIGGTTGTIVWATFLVNEYSDVPVESVKEISSPGSTIVVEIVGGTGSITQTLVTAHQQYMAVGIR